MDIFSSRKSPLRKFVAVETVADRDNLIHETDRVDGLICWVVGDNLTYKWSSESNSWVSFENDRYYWDDMRFPANDVSPGVASPPDWVVLPNGSNLYILEFNQNTEEEVYVVVQLPHDWRQGSAIRPHVHWINHNNTTGNVRWGLEYSIASANQVFPVSTVLYAVDACDVQYTHQIISFPEIDMTGQTISCILLIRVFRDADDDLDTANDDVGLLEFDIHYQKDSLGSVQEFIKQVQ